VVQQTLVLRMKFSGKNRQLLLAANRYGQVYEKTTKRTTTEKSATKE